jgi:D-alanyl-D-alanine carboxypeptidase
MKYLLFFLAILATLHPAHADSLDDIMSGNGNSKAAVPGIAMAYGTAIGGVTMTRGCARFGSDGATCAEQLTAKHLMRVASISKLVTALGAMRLVERGKLSLEADVSKQLGFKLRNPNFPNTPITLAMLLSHSSSLRDGETYWAEHPDTLASIFGKDSAHFAKDQPPGAYFTYTNLNYGVIAQLIERASGQRFDIYMQREVLGPLDLTGGYNWSGVEGQSLPVATLYRKKEGAGAWMPQVDDFGGGTPRVTVRSKGSITPNIAKLPKGSNGSLFSPQGGLRISVC